MFEKIVVGIDGSPESEHAMQVACDLPADQIIACAELCGADMIVTGRRGLGSIGSLVMGSTSQRVNLLAKCACLSVV